MCQIKWGRLSFFARCYKQKRKLAPINLAHPVVYGRCAGHRLLLKKTWSGLEKQEGEIGQNLTLRLLLAASIIAVLSYSALQRLLLINYSVYLYRVGQIMVLR